VERTLSTSEVHIKRSVTMPLMKNKVTLDQNNFQVPTMSQQYNRHTTSTK